jgi:hypothetical protein
MFSLRRIVIGLLLLAGSWLAPEAIFTQAATTERIVRINSAKSLSSMLRKVEKQYGSKARFVTMKLQIYLEDVYVSQGTELSIEPRTISRAIQRLLEDGLTRDEIARVILQKFQNGEFSG